MKTKLLFVVLISFLLSWTQSVKADTIPYQVPGNAQICQNPLAYDTFVFYKPIGFGSTVWYIDGTLVGSGDSIVFTPSAPGNYSIFSTWNSNVVPFMLSIYTAPPSHANFECLSGGVVNSTKDTLWMCQNTVSLSSNVDGNEATYFVWYGPGSFVSYDAPVSISIPGVYYHERGNPCGVVRDTIVVIQLPTTIPVWTDTTFCNASVSLTLDPGAGWDYSWNTGATTQSITVTDTGYYKVDLSNACATGSADIHVSHETYPEPSLFAYEGFFLCNHDAQILNPSPGFTYDTYDWSTGATTPTITVGAPSANYSVTVTVGACTSIVSDASILFYPLLTTPSVCIATVNAASGYNDVWFEPIDPLANVQGAESYNIYKLDGTYSLIGTVPASASAMVFTDVTSTPMVSAARYKISVVDTCGDESLLSYGHGTIKINSNPGTGGVVDLTIVDSYWDESGTYSPSKYYILVDSLNNGNLAVMDSMDAVFNSYTVLQPYLGATYVVGVAFPWACANGNKSVTLDQMSFSNKSAIVSGVDDYAAAISVSIYPNPSNGVFTVKGDNVVRIEVTDLTGRVLQVFDHPTSTLDLSGFADGMYNAHISTAQGSTNKSLMVVR